MATHGRASFASWTISTLCTNCDATYRETMIEPAHLTERQHRRYPAAPVSMPRANTAKPIRTRRRSRTV
jgi:hypothetical protein